MSTVLIIVLTLGTTFLAVHWGLPRHALRASKRDQRIPRRSGPATAPSAGTRNVPAEHQH